MSPKNMIEKDLRAEMRPWGIAIAFVLSAAEMQRLWGAAEGWVFLGLTLMTALIWVGEERGMQSVHLAADHIVEIMVAAILIAGVGLPLVRGGDGLSPVFFPLEMWAPLIATWWGLSCARLNTKHLAAIALTFFFVLHWGLEREGGHLADEKVIILAAVIALTRSWATLGTRGGAQGPATQPSSFLDAATGVYARPYFEAELMHIGAVSNRYRWPFSLIAIRIDGFQDHMSRVGADVARELERKAAWLISERIRSPDTAAHWSDGRFLVLLPSTEHDDAVGLANHLRKELLASGIGGDEPLSVSCAVSQHQYGDDPMATIVAAEDELGPEPSGPPQAPACNRVAH